MSKGKRRKVLVSRNAEEDFLAHYVLFIASTKELACIVIVELVKGLTAGVMVQAPPAVAATIPEILAIPAVVVARNPAADVLDAVILPEINVEAVPEP